MSKARSPSGSDMRLNNVMNQSMAYLTNDSKQLRATCQPNAFDQPKALTFVAWTLLQVFWPLLSFCRRGHADLGYGS